MTAARASLSVVIPAHNEEQVIGRTLDTLLRGAEPEELEVVVACNGCTDRTAQIAESFAPSVKVLVVAQASKAAALNAGDLAATALPRVFLDADIDVSISALRSVRDVLAATPGEGVPLAAAPQVQFDTEGCSYLVRAYYAVWAQLPYVSDGLLGTGFYAVSAAGRARFQAFPDLVADDLFVQRLFAAGERVTVPGTFRVRPPRGVAALLRSKARVYAGNRQYADAVRAGLVPMVAASTRRDAGTFGTRAALLVLAGKPRWWPRLLIYVAVVVVAKARAEVRVRRGQTTRWDQDTSGRAG